MQKYYKCDGEAGRCEWARNGQARTEAEWQCPRGNSFADCPKDEVGGFTAIRERHPRLLRNTGWILFGVAAIGLLLVLFLRDPLQREIEELGKTVSPLQNRLQGLEAKPSDTAGTVDRAAQLRQLAARAKELEGMVRASVDARRPEDASADLRTLEALATQAEAAVQAARNPKAASGTRAVEARQLIGEIEGTEKNAESLVFRAQAKRRQDLAGKAEQALSDLRAALKGARGLIPKPAVAVSASDLDRYAEEVKASLVKARTHSPLPPAVPFSEAEATLTISAASDLAPSLLLPVLAARSGGKAVSAAGAVWYYTSKPDYQPEEKIILHPAPESAYRELSAGRADLVFSDVQPSAEEGREFAAQFPGQSLHTRSSSEVVAFDAMTMLAPPGSEIELSPREAQAARWIGGPVESAEHAVATRFGFQIAQIAERPADAVLAQPSLRALGLFHKEGINLRAARIAYKPGPEARALKPSPYTIATEDYKFAFRILASHSPKSRPAALELVNHITSPQGQAVVADCRYVDLTLRPIGGDADPVILAILGQALGKDNIRGAVRMNRNFQFEPGKAELDPIKAPADLERLPTEIGRQYPQCKVVILGFTDNTGPAEKDPPLSVERAKIVTEKLKAAKVPAVPAGLGRQLPVDDNNTAEGRTRNRRAEVWVVPD